MLLGDLQQKFGLTNSEKWPGVGPFFAKERGKLDVGKVWEQFFYEDNFCDVGSYFRAAGPTYFGLEGYSSTIDRVIAPKQQLHNFTGVCVAWRSGRRLQLIPSKDCRDHYPLLAFFRYKLEFPVTSNPGDERIFWDYNRLNTCLQTGKYRHEFLAEMTQVLQSKVAHLEELSEQRVCDQHWWELIFQCGVVAKKHFAIKSKLKSPQQLAREKTSQERKQLLYELTYLREQSALGGTHSEHNVLDNLFYDLQCCQRRLRTLKRRVDAEAKHSIIEDLFLAHRRHQHSEVHRLARQLAGTGVGIRKRRAGILPSCLPCKEELLKLACEKAVNGGLEAEPIHFEAELDRWLDESTANPLKPLDCNVRQIAKSDLRGVAYGLLQGPKRKACPDWSLPTEIFCLLLNPGTCTGVADEGRGLGAEGNAELANYTLPRQCFENFLTHMHRTGEAPCFANLTRAFFIDKQNGKEGLDGLRMIHLFCIFWRHFFRQALRSSARLLRPVWDAWSYAYRAHCRREGGMTVTRVVEWRLQVNKLSTLNTFKDMRNAFCCTKKVERDKTLEELIVPDAALEANRYGHESFFRQRMNNTVVELWGEDANCHVMPRCGNIIGSAEGPPFFSRSFNRTISKWWQAVASISPSLKVVHPITNSVEEGGLNFFADDINTKHVVLDHSAETAAEICLQECSALNSFLSDGGWTQNVDKMELVTNIRAEHQNRVFPKILSKKIEDIRSQMIAENSQSAVPVHDQDQIDKLCMPRCLPHARHLGCRFVWNCNNHPEVMCRDRSMIIAWKELGRFWFEKAPYQLKRTILYPK